MSHLSQSIRKAAIVAGASAACLTGLAAPAQAAELTLNYKCEYPLIGKRLLTVEIDTNIPNSWPRGIPTNVWDVSAKSFAKEQTLTGLQLVSATSVEGSALATSTVNLPGVAALPVDVPITVPSTPAVGDENGDLVLTATGQTPELTFPTAGAGNITVDGIQLNLIARKADGSAVTTFSQIQPGPPSDTNPDTFDVYCVLDPATQSTKLKDITIFDDVCGDLQAPSEGMMGITCSPSGPTQPGPGSVSNVTETTATLSWGASTDNVGVVAYDVYNGLNKLGTTTTTSIDLTGLTADREYVIQVVARDAAGNLSDERVINFRTLSSDVVPPTQPGPVSVSAVTPSGARLAWGASTDNVGVVAYEVRCNGVKVAEVVGNTTTADLTGLAPDTVYACEVAARDTVGAISMPRAFSFRTAAAQPTVIAYSYDVKGSTVLRNLTRGTLPLSGSLDALLTLETQQFEAELRLNATKGTLKALGFLPVRATVSFTNAAKTTGAIATDGVVTSKSLVNIRLSSVNVFGIPLVAGNCRTQKPSEINLKSAAGFDLLAGGRMTGSYAISNLIDCGPLTVLVSPLTAGAGNTITVDLAGQAPSST